jgi:copper chaperone CopZ
MTTTSTFQVTGMTCGHCVGSVRSEVAAVDGVTDVDVDLATGRLTVTSETPIPADVVRSAVEVAGYEVVT